MPSRFWTYDRDQWDGSRWRPFFGGDEWGRRTIVLPIPFSGFLVVAYRNCYCEDCRADREYLIQHYKGEFREGRQYFPNDIFWSGKHWYRVIEHDTSSTAWPVTEKIS